MIDRRSDELLTIINWGNDDNGAAAKNKLSIDLPRQVDTLPGVSTP